MNTQEIQNAKLKQIQQGTLKTTDDIIAHLLI